MKSLRHYQKCKEVCLSVYNKLKQVVNDNTLSDVSELIKLGNDALDNALKGDSQVFIPVCISLNDCVGYYSDEITNLDVRKEYSLVRVGDIVKIEMGVVIDDCILHFGETFIAKGGKESRNNGSSIDYERIIKKLNEIPKRLCKKVYSELDEENQYRLVNDDVSNFITAECTKFDCYPVENSISYKATVSQYENQEEKIILGFKQKFSECDEWILLDNPCYDIQNGDVFNINITIVPERETSYVYNGKVYKQNEHIYSELHQPHLYRFTGESFPFRLKSVRDFINAVKPVYKTNFFNKNKLDKLVTNVKTKIGLQYTQKQNIVKSYPVVYLKRTSSVMIPVFYKKCTVYMWDDKLYLV